MNVSRKLEGMKITVFALAAVLLASGCAKTGREHTAANESYSGGYSQAGVTTTETRHSAAMGANGTRAEIQTGRGTNGTRAAVGASGTQAGMEAGRGQAGQEWVIPLYGENVRVGTRQEDAGSVRLRKKVTTETINQPVQVQRETLVIDRLPANGQRIQGEAAQPEGGQALNQRNGAAAPQPFQEGEVVINLNREVPVVETETVVTGRIVARKNVDTERMNVQRQVRRENIDVEKLGNAENVVISSNVGGAQTNGTNGARATATRPGTDQGRDAVGGAPGTSGEIQGTSQGKPLTSLAPIATATDKAALAGRQVQLSGARVQQVIGDRTIALRSENGSPVYVTSAQPLQGIQEGATVDVTGVIKRVPATTAQLDLGDEAAEALKKQQIHIHADKVTARQQQ